MLPEGDPQNPFESVFTLKVQLPGGTTAGETYDVTVEQVSVNADGTIGSLIGGNTYWFNYD